MIWGLAFVSQGGIRSCCLQNRCVEPDIVQPFRPGRWAAHVLWFRGVQPKPQRLACGRDMDAAPLVLELGRPAAHIDETAQRRDLKKLTECLNTFLKERYEAAIRNHPQNRPITRFCSSDGTPLNLNASWRKLVGQRVVRRRGKRSEQFLCERVFLKTTDSEGHRHCTMFLRDLQPLTSGNTGWALFACCMSLAPSVGEVGVRGPVLSVFCWYRGCYSVCERLVRQAHSKINQHSTSPHTDLENLTDLVVIVAESLHDISIAFLWSLLPWPASSETVFKVVWCVVTAVRQSVRHLDVEIGAVVVSSHLVGARTAR